MGKTWKNPKEIIYDRIKSFFVEKQTVRKTARHDRHNTSDPIRSGWTILFMNFIILNSKWWAQNQYGKNNS